MKAFHMVHSFVAAIFIIGAAASSYSPTTSSRRRLSVLAPESPGSPVPRRSLLPVEDDASAQDYCMTAYDLLSQDDQFTTFLAMVEVAEMQELLRSVDDQLTVYAPTNAAFEGYYAASGTGVDDLLTDEQRVAAILERHVLHHGAVDAAMPVEDDLGEPTCAGGVVHAVESVFDASMA